MAAGDKYVGCDNPSIGIQELLWAITVKQANGSYGLRVYSHSVADSALDPAITCDMPLGSLEDWLRRVIVLDANDKPAINLITAT